MRRIEETLPEEMNFVYPLEFGKEWHSVEELLLSGAGEDKKGICFFADRRAPIEHSSHGKSQKTGTLAEDELRQHKC